MTKRRSTKLPVPRSLHKLYPNIKHVVDASKPVEVSVSRKDCKDAKRLNPSECALARAAKREHHATGVIIGMSTSYIIRGNEAIRFQTPTSVQREIVSFDRHSDFAPGEYYLTPKSPSNRMGEDNRREKPTGPKKFKRKYHASARVRVLPKGADRV